jgi:hypothetical protein
MGRRLTATKPVARIRRRHLDTRRGNGRARPQTARLGRILWAPAFEHAKFPVCALKQGIFPDLQISHTDKVEGISML